MDTSNAKGGPELELLFTEFPPVSYDDWLAQGGADAKSKVLWGPWDPVAEAPQPWPAREWEMLESVPVGLFELSEGDTPVAQLRAALGSGMSAFLVPVDTLYFQEIAKFRALRRLFDSEIQVVAITGMAHQTVFDPHVNLLRSTVCGMAAILGGCDALIVRPFDAVRGEASDLGRRLARNTQHLLREESHLAEHADPAAGSWYIEALTQQLVEAARSDAEVAPLNWSRRVLVGTTKYADPTEKANVESVGEGRIATPWERLRLAVERSGKTPKIRIVMGSDRKLGRARADFVRSVFAAGGFTAGEPADFVVLCGADAEYPGMIRGLSVDLPVIVAGPECPGAWDSVNMKSDIPVKLRAWHQHMGIEAIR